MKQKDLPLIVTKPVEVVDHVATGAKMREARIAARHSLTEVAEALGIDISALSRMERGERCWDEEKAARFLAVLSGNS